MLTVYGKKLTLKKCTFFMNMHGCTNPTDVNDKTTVGSSAGEGVMEFDFVVVVDYYFCE